MKYADDELNLIRSKIKEVLLKNDTTLAIEYLIANEPISYVKGSIRRKRSLLNSHHESCVIRESNQTYEFLLLHPELGKYAKNGEFRVYVDDVLVLCTECEFLKKDYSEFELSSDYVSWEIDWQATSVAKLGEWVTRLSEIAEKNKEDWGIEDEKNFLEEEKRIRRMIDEDFEFGNFN